MNERIKELYNTVSGDDKLNFDSYLVEKFAELIVQECITVLYENDGALHHTELLKKHFGVES